MFYDYVKIFVKGGDGGNGSVAFRREKYVEYGGPSGGDGGHGAHVIFVGDDSVNTLLSFKYKQHYKADKGGHGAGKNMHGKKATTMYVKVPIGTIIKDDETGEILADVTEKGQEVIVARGGRGGRGNVRFASAKNRIPEVAEKGEPGIERWLRLELKIIADVGLLGMPSAGKSTIISKVSGSRPKIADYPFTTLVPNIGVVRLEPGCEFILADVPGLIEGAAEGSGLGHRFLRHIERTRFLIHVLDMSEQYERSPLQDFLTINNELSLYREDLAERIQIIAANKMDSEGAEERLEELKEALGDAYEIYPISAINSEGLNELMWRAYNLLQEIPKPIMVVEDDFKLTTVEEDDEEIILSRDMTGGWVVNGIKVEKIVKMTDWNNEAALMRLQNILIKIGVDDALRKAGARNGDLVTIAGKEFEFAE